MAKFLDGYSEYEAMLISGLIVVAIVVVVIISEAI